MSGTDCLADLYREVVRQIDCGRAGALAVVLRTDGAAPQKPGARVVVDRQGRIRGTVGGGVVEAETQRRAVEACKAGTAVVFDLDLADDYARDAGPICGGAMRILIDPTVAKDRDCYARAADAISGRRRGVLLTRISTAARPRVTPPEVTPPEVTPPEVTLPEVTVPDVTVPEVTVSDVTVPDVTVPDVTVPDVTVPDVTVSDVTVRWFPQDAMPSDSHFPGRRAIAGCLAKETPRLFVEDTQRPGQTVEVFVEPVVPRPRLLIAGGGHVGRALAVQAVLVGFDVTVIDDRPEFTQAARFPEGVSTLCGDVPREVARLAADEDTYVVIVTRGHRQDAETLQGCVHRPLRYIGMIGSRRKVELIRRDFVQSGLATEEELDRVCAPIGLDVGAVTVPEIAAAITAELVAVRRQGSARP